MRMRRSCAVDITAMCRFSAAADTFARWCDIVFPSRHPREGRGPYGVCSISALLDNPFQQEIFATGVSGVANLDGVVVMTLECTRVDHSVTEPRVERTVVGRVAMSVTAAQLLVANLNNFLETQGLSPSRAVAAGATFQ